MTTPTFEPLYHHYLLVDRHNPLLIAIAKARVDRPDERSVPLFLADEVDGPFLRNLLDRQPQTGSEVFGSNVWNAWSISEAEWTRLARLGALAAKAREFNQLRAI